MTDRILTEEQVRALDGFTEGPWVAGKGAGWFVKREGRRAALVVGMTPDYSIVSDGRVGEFSVDNECEANASLIEAAPDMRDTILHLYAALAAERAEADRLREALIWCSGSNDFHEGGVAREGWLKLCAPILRTLTPKGGDHG